MQILIMAWLNLYQVSTWGKPKIQFSYGWTFTWAGIKHKKGKADNEDLKFSQLSRDSVAAKLGDKTLT